MYGIIKFWELVVVIFPSIMVYKIKYEKINEKALNVITQI